MTVVILDTNALPHGQYSERVLTNLIEIASREASIVVPEVVNWEWAEHAREAQEPLAEVARQHRVGHVFQRAARGCADGMPCQPLRSKRSTRSRFTASAPLP